MSIRPILKMGDPRLLRVARPVTEFGTPWLAELGLSPLCPRGRTV